MKEQLLEEFEDCPRCGYFFIRNSLLAECSRCDYLTNKEKHNERVAIEKGFKSYKHYKEFIFNITI